MATEHESAAPATLLIVDDDCATREGLARLLADAGYRVLTADSFERALARLKSNAPDLVLLDVRLGDFNGLQLLVTAPRPVAAIVITGYPDAVLERDARQLGAEYLVKPITRDLLLSAIDRALRVPSSGRERRWQRKHLRTALPTHVNRAPAQVLDVSYGGVRLHIDEVFDDLPSNLALAVPGFEQAIQVEVIWSVREPERTWQCGAAIVESDELLTKEWRDLVDSM